MLSLIIPCKVSEENIEETVSSLFSYFSFRFPGEFEIIVVPNPIPLAEDFSTYILRCEPLKKLMSYASRHKQIRVIPHFGRAGKYSAIKTGVKNANGDWIFFTDADLPFELSFFDEAAVKLRAGEDFVVGNRRHPQSQIRTRMDLLKRALVRDRIGRVFNFAVRCFFPSISARDTQAGIKAMTRQFAHHAFQVQVCPGFYGDIELFLVAAAHAYKFSSVPVIFNYGANPSSIKFFQEFFVAISWLTKIFFRDYLGAYEASVDMAPRVEAELEVSLEARRSSDSKTNFSV
jgi:dolichyl-phosphate beta-glucosyltransferase